MMIDASEIKEHMPVKDVSGNEVQTVDGVEGDFLKLTKDEHGQHHWITLDLVESVDEHVHLNIGEEELKALWLLEDPHSPEKVSGG